MKKYDTVYLLTARVCFYRPYKIMSNPPQMRENSPYHGILAIYHSGGIKL